MATDELLGTASGLLERARFLQELGTALDDVASSREGRLVLLTGEAGIGKTTLVGAFCAALPREALVLRGSCDSLFTPRALGPFVDIAEMVGGTLEHLVAVEAPPREVLTALLEDVRSRGPVVLVLEDLHWADEATLDLVRLLARRLAAAPVLGLVTFRDDELDPSHPLRIVVGDLATEPAVTRLDLPRLSRAAVWQLAEPLGVDPDELYRQTGGNPFFVTEVLGTGGTEIPRTVRDAVLARVARLGGEARRLLELVAVVPSHVEPWLLESAAADTVGALDECLASGMLRQVGERVAFRHEIARLAVLESVAPHRRLALERAVLHSLERPVGAALDLARLAHHAEGALDANAVLRYAPAAAEHAAAVGAHREAAAQYERALRFSEALPLERRAEFLDRCSYECYLTDLLERAIELRRLAVQCHHLLGDARAEGDALVWLSRLLFFSSRMEEADAAAHRAVELLEALPPGPELAHAYSGISHLRMLAGDDAEAVLWGERAIELAERVGEPSVFVHALNNVGSAQFRSGSAAGRATLERSLRLAQAHGLTEHAVRAYVNLTAIAVDLRRYDLAGKLAVEAVDFAATHEVSAWRWYLAAVQARLLFEQGRWADAKDAATLVVERARPDSFGQLVGLTILGRLATRTGREDPWPLLDRAADIARLTGHLQQVGPVAAARAEAASLAGRPDAVVAESEIAWDLAKRRRDPWLLGELALWRWKAGVGPDGSDGLAEPFALQIDGRPLHAAERWATIGCPYEAAVARADSEDEAERRRALSELRALGAAPAARSLERQLRAGGARGLRHGPRAATRGNPGGLTARQLEVLALLATGLSNPEIAARLVVSPKTVEHHVSAILRTLGVRSRVEAGVAAARLGVTEKR